MTEKEEVLSESDAFEIALRDHPEWRRKWGKGELPDEIPGEDGQPMNPHLHLTIHTLVERQLAADEPKGILAIAGELEQLGVSRHDMRHAIGTVITNHLWHMHLAIGFQSSTAPKCARHGGFLFLGTWVSGPLALPQYSLHSSCADGFCNRSAFA